MAARKPRPPESASGITISERTPRTMGTVFISYRRADSIKDARAVYERLRRELGDDRVFVDLEGIEPGEDFVTVIERHLEGCDALVVLIGRLWFGAADENGHTRIHDESDFVRIEISTALRRGIRVFPVLLDGAMPPSSDQLPEELRPMVRRQALSLDYARFDQDIAKLGRALKTALEQRRTTSLADSPPYALGRVREATAANSPNAEVDVKSVGAVTGAVPTTSERGIGVPHHEEVGPSSTAGKKPTPSLTETPQSAPTVRSAGPSDAPTTAPAVGSMPDPEDAAEAPSHSRLLTWGVGVAVVFAVAGILAFLNILRTNAEAPTASAANAPAGAEASASTSVSGGPATPVSDAEVRAEYDKLPLVEYLVSVIRVDTESEARGLMRPIQQGERFEDLAARYSKDKESAIPSLFIRALGC